MKQTGDNQEEQSTHRRVTLRDIAAEMGISHVTVSKALRNLSGVSEKRKLMIQQKADQMGYIPDPLLASLSRYRASSQIQPIQSQIAWLNLREEHPRCRKCNEFELYRQGAADCARRLGYHLESFDTQEIPIERLRTILRTRNIQGILVPPLHTHSVELEQIDWSSFATVRFGQAVSGPETHFVTSAQIANAMLAFDRVRDLGYQRIGFVCEYWPTRFFSAGFSWAQKTLPDERQLPALTLSAEADFKSQQCVFEKWLHQHRPDAIITDRTETRVMLQNLGYRIPEDVGLATMSIHDTTINSGIDQSPYEIGRAAVRMLTALIAERSFGIPEQCNEILIKGKWIDGSMLPNCQRS